MPLRWKKLECFKLELPRETLLSVEIVQELKGEVGDMEEGGRPTERRGGEGEGRTGGLDRRRRLTGASSRVESQPVLLLSRLVPSVCSTGQSPAPDQRGACSGRSGAQRHRHKRPAL